MTKKNVLEGSSLHALLAEVRARGYFSFKQPLRQGSKIVVDTSRWGGDSFSFAVVSDTHCGSLYFQRTALEEFYSVAGDRGIQLILHAGDLCDGTSSMHAGMEFELAVHGADQMVAYAKDIYPYRRGIVTKVISGNHDAAFWKESGTNIVQRICDQRRDMEYLGDTLAFVQIGAIRIALMHGSGNVAYARSYRLQKIIEQLAPENKPNFLFLGHKIKCVLT
jgi:predicted phosphodiesterase